MKETVDTQVPVVHIRVIREKKGSEFPCDLCLQTFSSTEKLNEHVINDHPSVDIQDVFICPVCRYCLLSKNDLHEHLYFKHQMLPSNVQQPALCEFCGTCVVDPQSLEDHQRTLHHIQNSETLNYEGERVELTLKDISSMGIGEPGCKTLFHIIECPIVQESVDSKIVCERNEEIFVKECSSIESNFTSECSTPNTEWREILGDAHIINDKSCDDTLASRSYAISSNSLVQNNPGYAICVDSNDRTKNVEENSQTDDSHIEMIICCNSGEKSVESPASGEIILTVESDQELIWSDDFMSQVINSSGILKRNLDIDGYPTHAKNSGISYSFQVENKKEDFETNCIKSLQENTMKKINNGHDEEAVNSLASYTTRKLRGARQKKCTICGMVFRQLIDLEQHENIHHGIRVKCDLCDETFAFSKSLRNHYQRKHSSRGKFQCQECYKNFKCRSNLWSHRLTHMSQEARRFACSECPQRFHTKTKLNVHLQGHTGQKKYQCGECHKGFVYQGLLLNHMRKHFPDSQTCPG